MTGTGGNEELAMGQQAIRQQARRQAREAQQKRRAERAEQEKRVRGYAEDVLTALAERDATVVDCERRAGVAVVAMVEREGLRVAETVKWCDQVLTAREVHRLRRAVEAEEPAETSDAAGGGSDDGVAGVGDSEEAVGAEAG